MRGVLEYFQFGFPIDFNEVLGKVLVKFTGNDGISKIISRNKKNHEKIPRKLLEFNGTPSSIFP
jgi:hypothetical protein